MQRALTSRQSMQTAVALVAVTASLLFACVHTPEPAGPCATPPPFHVSLRASDRLNADSQGRSLPTVVRILQLKRTERLQAAEFAEVWSNPEDILGPDLLTSEEITIDPGQSVTRWPARHPDASSVAVVGLFRQPSGTAWRSIAPLPSVPAAQCTPDPKPRSGPPRTDDAQLGFFLEDFRVTRIEG